MPVRTNRWAVAPQVSASGGEWITAGALSFWLRNRESGTTNTMVFGGLGGGGGLVPISAGVTWVKSFHSFTSNRATAFEEIDSKGAIVRTAAAIGPGGTDMPNANWVWLRILEGVNPWGAAIMDFHIWSGGLGGRSGPPSGFASPDISVNRWWGMIKIITHAQEPLDPPEVPDTPENPPHYPGYSFIPSVKPPAVKPRRVTIDADVMFGFDSARIKPEAQAELSKLAHELEHRANPNVTIEGHADSTGAATYNKHLSYKRAEAVKEWFIAHRAPAAQGYAVFGYGEERPVASNTTSAGRAKNRRVEIDIL